MARKLRSYKLYNPVYDYDIYVKVGHNPEQLLSWFDGLLNCDSSGVTNMDSNLAVTLKREDMLSHAIWFKYPKPPARVVAHEAFHSVVHIMRVLGRTDCTREAEECWACLLDWTVREIGKRVW